ncbi:hypothetical protein GEMRC1_007792 [Eukaryota sp. GEM-RC1]
MGSSASKISDEEALNYSTQYKFDSWEIKKLHNRFIQMDADKDGQITRQELLLLPELVNNPLKERVFALIPDKKEKLTFEDFLETIKPFATKSSQKLKLEAAFKLYDVDGDQLITHSDLTIILTSMLKDLMSEKDINHVVTKAMEEADTDGNGDIDEEEFHKIMSAIDLRQRLSFQVTSNVNIKHNLLVNESQPESEIAVHVEK